MEATTSSSSPARPSQPTLAHGPVDSVALFTVALAMRLLVPLTTGGLTGIYGYDASVYYGAGAAFVHGRLPYADFVMLHPPGVMLATAPAAWLATLTTDQAGFAVANVLFAAIGAVNAVLVAAIARRLRLGRAASIAGGLFYATWFVAVHAEYQTRLEPLGNLLLLGGLLACAGVGGRSRRRDALLCGAALGAATCVKIWYAVPVIVVVGWVLVTHGRRAAARVALGSAAVATVVCGPFFARAPVAMWDMVVTQQFAREPSNWLRRTLLLQRLPAEVGSWSVVYVIDAVLLITAALLALLAWRAPSARLPVLLLLAQFVVLLAAPSWFVFYLDYLAPAAAMCVAAGVWLLRASTGGRARGAVTTAAAVAVVAVLVVPAVGLWYGRGSGTAPFPSARLAPAVADARCVVSDAPTGLIALNALSRNLANGCRNWIDVTGRTYAADMIVRRADGERVPRTANVRWQRALRDYLLSGDAVIIRRARASGMDAVTWAAIRRGGVLAVHDGQTVYRVRRERPPSPGGQPAMSSGEVRRLHRDTGTRGR